MGEFKWCELGILYLLVGVKLLILECVKNVKDIMKIEFYIEYLKRI